MLRLIRSPAHWLVPSVIQNHRNEAPAGVATTENHDNDPWFHRALATLRIAFGITFLWAFLDKTFALGFLTGYDPEGLPARCRAADRHRGGRADVRVKKQPVLK